MVIPIFAGGVHGLQHARETATDCGKEDGKSAGPGLCAGRIGTGRQYVGGSSAVELSGQLESAAATAAVFAAATRSCRESDAGPGGHVAVAAWNERTRDGEHERSQWEYGKRVRFRWRELDESGGDAVPAAATTAYELQSRGQ